MTTKVKEEARDAFNAMPYEHQKVVLSTLYDWIKNDFETLRHLQACLIKSK